MRFFEVLQIIHNKHSFYQLGGCLPYGNEENNTSFSETGLRTAEILTIKDVKKLLFEILHYILYNSSLRYRVSINDH